jgi:hypothetical protein
MQLDPIAIAHSCYQAYVDNDRAAIEPLISADFHFTSPLDNRIDRTTYFERCWPNSETITGYDFIHVLQNGDRVFVTYEARSTNGNRFRNSEILTIRKGQLVDVEVYFGWNIPHDAPPGRSVSSA